MSRRRHLHPSQELHLDRSRRDGPEDGEAGGERERRPRPRSIREPDDGGPGEHGEPEDVLERRFPRCGPDHRGRAPENERGESGEEGQRRAVHARDRADRREDKERSREPERGRLPLLRRDAAAAKREPEPDGEQHDRRQGKRGGGDETPGHGNRPRNRSLVDSRHR